MTQSTTCPCTQTSTVYLKDSTDYGIIYSHDGRSFLGCKITLKDSIYGFTHSNYAMDPDTCHSISAAFFLLAGAPVSWRSQLQSSVSLSSTESQYIPSTQPAQTANRLSQLMREP